MQVALLQLFLLAGAGSLGALTRHGVHTAARQVARAHAPVGTLLINVVGAFAIGIVLGWPGSAHATLRGVLATGFLGGFTTFSTLSLEAWTLGTTGRRAVAWAYALGSVAAGLLAAWAGVGIAPHLAAIAHSARIALLAWGTTHG